MRKLYGKTKLKFLEVPCTNLNNINFESINKNIKLSKYVLCARDSKGQYLFAFNNAIFECELLEIVEKLGLDAKYNYYLNLGEEFIIMKEIIVNGRNKKAKETRLYPRSEYNIAKCLA